MQDRILKEFKGTNKVRASQLSRKFRISRQAIHRHLQALIRQRRIMRLGTSRKTTFYVLNTPSSLKAVWGSGKSFKKRYSVKGLQEDAVYKEAAFQPYLLNDLPESVRHLFRYAFTEMVNNAIDHSKTRFIDILVERNPQNVSFTVTDHGIGVFENIRAKKGLLNEMEALQDLLKGKQTTLPEYHSGEGIFFTSKAADRFVMESHRKRLIVDDRRRDLFVEEVHFRKGTRILFDVDPRTPKKIEEIFRQYTNEEYQFQKSRVAVKLFQQGEEYVSRSQAKRLLHALIPFREVTLDFEGVKAIGQGFADEIFRVFASQHPETAIVPINYHENVWFMIQRAKNASS